MTDPLDRQTVAALVCVTLASAALYATIALVFYGCIICHSPTVGEAMGPVSRPQRF